MPDTNEIIERERQFLLQTYHRYPLVLQRGKGVFLYDLDGKRYLDFVAGLGVNALGHAHPRIVKVIREQAARVIHLSNLYYNEFQGLLAEKLCRLSGLQRAFFSNSGTEAIEGSIKLARLAGHRIGGQAKSQLVGLEGSYHGRTFGAMSLTGQDKYRKGFEPLLEDVKFVPRDDLEALRAVVNDNTCAIVLEPIFGEGGIHECSVDFLNECRALADRHRAALIFDEIQCGLGRTGTIFAFQSFGERSTVVREVRGRGFILGLQLDIPARPIVEQAFGAGVLFNSTQDTVLRFLPPFLLQEKHVDKGVRVLKKLLGKAKKS